MGVGAVFDTIGALFLHAVGGQVVAALVPELDRVNPPGADFYRAVRSQSTDMAGIAGGLLFLLFTGRGR